MEISQLHLPIGEVADATQLQPLVQVGANILYFLQIQQDAFNVLQLLVVGVVCVLQNRNAVVDLQAERMDQVVHHYDILELTIFDDSEILNVEA